MLGITLGRSCAPKDGLHHFGSLNLLGNVLLIPSGCLFGFVLPHLNFLLYFLCVFHCWSWRGCFYMFGISFGTSCAPKESPDHSGSPNLLENVLLIPSGSFGGRCFSKSPVYCTLSLYVYFLRFGRASHMLGNSVVLPMMAPITVAVPVCWRMFFLFSLAVFLALYFRISAFPSILSLCLLG